MNHWILKPRRSALVAWGLIAALNLAAGVAIASWPERQTDLETIRRWGGGWLDGRDVYNVGDETPKYPPHAIVVLSPLSVIPERAVVPVWAGVNLGLALLAPYLAVRAVSPAATLSAAALPILMLLCWGGFRTLLQFSLLPLTAGLLAMNAADRHPGWSGVWLGLALIKPHIGVPFALWALFTRRSRVIAIALAAVAAGFLIFCIRAGANPVGVAVRYGEILWTFHTGDSALAGLAQLRPLVADALSRPTAVADGVSMAVALLLLAGVGYVGVWEGGRRSTIVYSAPALAGLWSLLTFYHLTYGFVLLLPMAAQLIFDNDARTAGFRKRVFWTLQIGLMADVPGLWRRFGHLVGEPEAVGAVAIHFDRALMLTLFACVLLLANRASGRAARCAPSPSIPV